MKSHLIRWGWVYSPCLLVFLAACTAQEWQDIGADVATEVTQIPEKIAENPTPLGLILAIAGAAVAVFSKSFRRGFGKASVVVATTTKNATLTVWARLAAAVAAVIPSFLKSKEPPGDPK